MRTYGVLTDNGDCLYLYENLSDIDLEETELSADDQIVRIDGYTVLANGPAASWKKPDK